MITGYVKIVSVENLIFVVKYKITAKGLSVWCGSLDEPNPHWIFFNDISSDSQRLIIKQLWFGKIISAEVG